MGLLLLILFSLMAKIRYMPQYPYYADEAISIMAAKGILVRGVPSFENGKSYNRSFVGHYLLAIPTYFFGVNEYSVRSIAVIFSILLIVLVYFMGKDLYNEYVGLLAATLLVFARFENNFALSARFYMVFQFFYILTLFLFYKGFIEENNKYKILAVISFLFTIFSHRLSFELVPILLISLFLIKGWKWFKDKYIIGGMFLAGVAYYITVYYKFSNAATGYYVPSLGVASYRGSPFIFFEHFEHMVAYGLALIVLGLFYLYADKDKKLLFYYLSFGIGMVIISLIAPMGSPRYALNSFPLYILLLSYALVRLIRFSYSAYYEKGLKQTVAKSIWHKALVYMAISILCIVVLGESIYHGEYGFSPYKPDHKDSHLLLKKNMQEGDILVSTNPWITEMYVRKPDFFLRENQLPDGRWSTFPTLKDAYDYYMLDSTEKLRNLMKNKEKSVWIFTDDRYDWSMNHSPEMKSFISENFKLFYQKPSPKTKIFVYNAHQ